MLRNADRVGVADFLGESEGVGGGQILAFLRDILCHCCYFDPLTMNVRF